MQQSLFMLKYAAMGIEKGGFDSNGMKKAPLQKQECIFHGDPYGNRTHVTAVKGRCLNRLTNGPGSGDLT